MAQKKDKDQGRKPKYIENLLKQAEIRTKENERRIERQVQKEREAEGDEFADKEKFVTSAYRKKMEEMQKLDAEDKRQDAIENMLDVTKQKDMSGFYRHILRQTMGEEKGQKAPAAAEQDEESPTVEDQNVNISNKRKPSQRSYRHQHDHEKEALEEDSKSSSSSSSADEEEEKVVEATEQQRIEKDKERRETLRKQKDKRERRKRRIDEGRDSSSSSDDSEVEADYDKGDLPASKKSKVLEETKERAVATKKEPKPDIWKKVTVDQVFDAALLRYLERKAERGSRFPW